MIAQLPNATTILKHPCGGSAAIWEKTGGGTSKSVIVPQRT